MESRRLKLAAKKKRRDERKAIRTELHQMTKHHLTPVSKGTDGEVSYVPFFKHVAWNNLFGVKNPQEIADVINSTWIPKNFMFIVVPRPQ